MQVNDLVAVKFGIYRGCAVRLIQECVHAHFSSQFTGYLENASGFWAVVVDGPEDLLGTELRLPAQYFEPISYASALESLLTPVRCDDDMPYGC